MSTTTGPVTLTAGQQLNLRAPGNAQQYGAVVLQNLSPFLCAIGAGAGAYLLAPYTADVFLLPTGGQGVSVTPTALDTVMAGVSANIAAVWYDPTEEPDGTYPCALSSPAAIAAFAAADTAAALLAQGVPNVLNNQLASIILGMAAGASTLLDIHTYASLSVIANGTASLILELEYHQSTDGTGISFSEFLTNIDGNNTPGTWALPVNAGSVRLWNRSAASINLVVYGSNRQIAAAVQEGNGYTPRLFSKNTAWVNGTGQVLTAADGGPTSSQFNRNVFYSFTSGTIAGQLYLQFVRRDGTVDNVFVASCAANSSVTGTIAHPLSVCNWLMLPQGTATTTGQLRVIQAILS